MPAAKNALKNRGIRLKTSVLPETKKKKNGRIKRCTSKVKLKADVSVAEKVCEPVDQEADVGRHPSPNQNALEMRT